MVITTGRNAPTTHVSWNRVSNRANDRPRLASGASRWTTESKASFPLLAASPTQSASAAAAAMPPAQAARRPATAVAASTICRMRSSAIPARRRGGATSDPSSAPMPLAASTRPNW